MRLQCVWREDDCTVNDIYHECMEAAYTRLTGKHFSPLAAVRVEDGGDHKKFFMPGGYVCVASYPGGDAILMEAPGE